MYSMEKRLYRLHTGFLQHVTGNRSRQQRYGSWRREGAVSVLQAAGTQLLRNYIGRSQATVAEWVATHTIFEVCAQDEIWYTVGGKRQDLWWTQTAADAYIRDALKAI